MNIQVNGEQKQFEKGTTVFGLIETLNLIPQATVVQRNDDVVMRKNYPDTVLNEGDNIELVRVVGGG